MEHFRGTFCGAGVCGTFQRNTLRSGLYNSSPAEATYYSKLAIIELCGWIEHSMDNIADNFANRHLSSIPFKDIYLNVKTNTFGFEYKKNFRKMLGTTIGLHNMETIELSLTSTGEIAILEANLTSLKILRDNAAHTFINATTTYQAPSVTKSQLLIIYPILKKIGQQVRTL
ncbi:MAG: hypothetical protein H7174_13110 [Flavobacterium sp.]|nr:hypothetical protein [Flavobacterium sp.]